MLPVKHTVIYTFFCYNVSPKTLVFAVFFNALASKKNPAKSCYVHLCTMFFSFFGRFFHCRKATQNDPKFHFNTLLRSDNPKILEKCRKHHRILVSVRKPFLAPPPPPAKADIATAILTNVIEHLVLLLPPLPPNKHAFTAKAVWADFRGKKWVETDVRTRHFLRLLWNKSVQLRRIPLSFPWF